MNASYLMEVESMIQRIGAQTIVWGEDIRDNMEAILTFLAGNGYQGVETGIRHFYLDRHQAYRELYEKTGIILLGIHSGGKFWDPEQANDEMKKIENTVAFASRARIEAPAGIRKSQRNGCIDASGSRNLQ